MDNYYVLIGDIKGSKQIKDRNGIQIKLREILKEVNSIYKQEIKAKLTIVRGDEFVGVLYNDKEIYNIIDYIKEKMKPQQLRYGIGYGKLSFFEEDKVLGIGGKGYETANKAINYAKENDVEIKKMIDEQKTK